MAWKDVTDRLTWEGKARRNPLWAVMSVDEFAQADADPSSWTAEQLALFFDKGRVLFDISLRPSLTRAEIQPERGLLVEYGSGMGRILRPVHKAGYRCSGVNISATMLEHRRRLLPEVTDLHLVQADGGVPLADASADYVYSYAVLQHIPDDISAAGRVGDVPDSEAWWPAPAPIPTRLHAVWRSVPGCDAGVEFRPEESQVPLGQAAEALAGPLMGPRVPIVPLQQHTTGASSRFAGSHAGSSLGRGRSPSVSRARSGGRVEQRLATRNEGSGLTSQGMLAITNFRPLAAVVEQIPEDGEPDAQCM